MLAQRGIEQYGDTATILPLPDLFSGRHMKKVTIA